MKKIIKLFITMGIVIISIVVFVLMQVFSYVRMGKGLWVHDFEEYEEDYGVIAEVVYEQYEQYGVNYTDEEDYAFVATKDEGGSHLFNTEVSQDVVLSENEQDSLDKVFDSYPSQNGLDSDLEGIYVNEEPEGVFVEFKNIHGYYELVYSVDGTRPIYIDEREEYHGVNVTRVNNNWYHVVWSAKRTTKYYAR